MGALSWTTDHKNTTDSAANLNGTYFKTAEPSLDTTKSYSVSAWVKLTNTDTFQTFVTQNGNQRGAYYLQYSKAYNAWAFVAPGTDDYGTGIYHHANATTAPQLNTWTHLVATFDADTKAMTLYVNGQYSQAPTPTPPPGTPPARSASAPAPPTTTPPTTRPADQSATSAPTPTPSPPHRSPTSTPADTHPPAGLHPPRGRPAASMSGPIEHAQGRSWDCTELTRGRGCT
ncbi:LamG domain-containing protein [Kitasatospora gansuensis]